MMNTNNNYIEGYTMTAGKANRLALLFLIPIIVIFCIPFVTIWGFDTFNEGRILFFKHFIFILIPCVLMHELFHGIFWAIYTNKGFQSVSFGISWKHLTPYTHCKEPLVKNHYAIGSAAPLIIMGLIPGIISVIIGNAWLCCFGIIFTWGATGDIISLWALRKYPKNTRILDHPDKLGFLIESVI